jgi:hypothetical protein
MSGRAIHTALRVAFAGLGLAAIGYQLLDLMAKGTLDPVNFFSYFTIQSNLIGIAALLWAAVAGGGVNPRLDSFRGAATTYLAITFVVFALLLAETDVDTAVFWVDRVLHRIMPMVLVIDWLIDPPTTRLSWRRAAWWLAYPLAWLAYTMARGALTDRYPYPFLDPANGGYGTVAIYSVAIFVGSLLAIACIMWAGNAIGSRSREEASPVSAGTPLE